MAGTYDTAFAPLRAVYLEDSWVVAIDPSENAVVFSLDLVLTSAHEQCSPPRAGEQYCYVDADLTLTSAAPIEFEPSGRPPGVDASGGIDLGHIDVFAPNEPSDSWLLEGDWGRLRIKSPIVDVEFT